MPPSIDSGHTFFFIISLSRPRPRWKGLDPKLFFSHRETTVLFLPFLETSPKPYKKTIPVRHFLSQLESELGTDAPVRAAAQLVARINYNNKASLLGAMIVAGYDKRGGGGQVYGVPIGGTLVKQEWATDGSGSTYIWGYLDDAYRPGMRRDEAEKLVVTSLALAMSIDGSSGGMARLVTITESGAERRIVRGDEVPQFWDALEAPGKALGGGEDSFVVV